MGDNKNIGDVLELAILNRPFDIGIALRKAPPQPSENWERDALASTLWLLVHGKKIPGADPNFDTPAEIAAWYPRQDFCGSEDFARIYGGRNVASAVAAREAFRKLGNAEGLAFLTDWTRAMAGYVALSTGWSWGRNVSYDKIVNSIAPGKPHLIVSEPGAGPNPDIRGANCFTMPGDRSFAHNGIGWLAGSGLCSLPHLILGDEATFLRCRTTHPAFSALKSQGCDISLCTPEEGELAKRAMNNDLEALLTIWNHWLPKAPWPRDRFMVVRRTTGVESARMGGSEAPTAQLDYCSWEAATQQQRFMAVNDAYRQDWILSSAVKFDGATWTAYTDNPDELAKTGRPYTEISCPALVGEIVFQVAFGEGDETLLIFPKAVPPPPAPEPTPTPRPDLNKRKGCFGRF